MEEYVPLSTGFLTLCISQRYTVICGCAQYKVISIRSKYEKYFLLSSGFVSSVLQKLLLSFDSMVGYTYFFVIDYFPDFSGTGVLPATTLEHFDLLLHDLKGKGMKVFGWFFFCRPAVL